MLPKQVFFQFGGLHFAVKAVFGDCHCNQAADMFKWVVHVRTIQMNFRTQRSIVNNDRHDSDITGAQ